MAVGIEINGRFLTLYPDTVVSISEEHDLYSGGDSQIVVKPKSLPFKVPTLPNAFILNNSHIPGSYSSFPFYENVNIYIGEGYGLGIVFYVGTLYVSESNSVSTEVFFIEHQPGLSDKKFKDFNFGFYQVPGITDNDYRFVGPFNPNTVGKHMQDTCEHPEDWDYVCPPMYNPKCISIEGDVSQYFQNYWQTFTPAHICPFQLHSDSIDPNPRNRAFTPFLKLKFIIEKIGQFLNYGIQDNIMATDPELETLYLYSNADLKRVLEKETTPPSEVTNKFYYPSNFIHYNNMTPYKLTLVEFIKQYAKMFWAAIYVDYKERRLLLLPLRDIINQPMAFDFTDNLVSDISVQKDADIPSGFAYNEDSADDYYKSNVYQNIEDLGYGTPTLHMAVPQPITPGFYYVYHLDEYHYIESGPDDRKIFKFFDKIKTQNTKGTLAEITASPLFADQFIPAHTGCSAAIAMSPRGNTSETVRLFFYRGMKTYFGCGNKPKPVTSNNDYDLATASVGYNFSLLMQGENGIFEKWAKQWVGFLETKTLVKFSLKLSIGQLSLLKPYHKIRVGSNHYLIKSRQINVSMSGLQPVNFVAIPCN